MRKATFKLVITFVGEVPDKADLEDEGIWAPWPQCPACKKSWQPINTDHAFDFEGVGFVEAYVDQVEVDGAYCFDLDHNGDCFECGCNDPKCPLKPPEEVEE